MINETREKVHGVNTIYFLQPTEDNIDRILEDFSKDLYDSVYINFSYPISLDLLQKLAKGVGKSNGVQKLKAVNQYHLNFITPTPTLFDFNIKDIYMRIRDHEEAPQLVEEIAHSLISVMMNLRMLPVVFYQPGFAETVAKKIEVSTRCSLRDEFLVLFQLAKHVYQKYRQALLHSVCRLRKKFILSLPNSSLLDSHG